jgi:tight adherence protein B
MLTWHSPLLAALLGTAAAIGLLLAADGSRREIRRTRSTTSPSRATLLLAGGALLSGAFVWLATGWPVAAVFAATAAATLPRMLSGGASRRARTDRIEAIGAWTESLRDSLVEAAGVEQAIIAASARPPEAIAEDIAAAMTPLHHHRQPLSEALAALQVRLNDPIADLVIAQLLVAAQAPTGRLAATLTRIAEQARHHVTLRLDIEADRAPIRTELRLVIAITIGLIGGLRLLRPQFLTPYHSLGGQAVLTGVGILIALGLAVMTVLNRDTGIPRVLFTDANGSAITPAGVDVSDGGR